MPDDTRQPRQQILIAVGDRDYRCSSHEEAVEVLLRLQADLGRQFGDDPYLRLAETLDMVSRAGERGVPPSTIQAALGLTSPRAVSGVSKSWARVLRELGFRSMNQVLANREAWRGHSRWYAGPRIDEARQALEDFLSQGT